VTLFGARRMSSHSPRCSANLHPLGRALYPVKLKRPTARWRSRARFFMQSAATDRPPARPRVPVLCDRHTILAPCFHSAMIRAFDARQRTACKTSLDASRAIRPRTAVLCIFDRRARGAVKICSPNRMEHSSGAAENAGVRIARWSEVGPELENRCGLDTEPNWDRFEARFPEMCA